MDEQEIFDQIGELQKQRTLLKEQENHLVIQIMELKSKLKPDDINKRYYTSNNGLFCKVCDIKDDNIFVYELDTIEPPCITKETYCWNTFINTYRKECTKEEYNNALDKIVKSFKD